MKIIEYNAHKQRVWIFGQRIHHGPIGLVLGALAGCDRRMALPERIAIASMFALWGLSDLPDYRVWFISGHQE